MSTKKRFSIFIFFIFLIFAILTYQSVGSTSGTSPFSFIAYPLKVIEQGISEIISGAGNFFKSYVFVVGREDENRKLKERINKMEQERNRYVEAVYENERLRRLLELKSQRADYVASAEIFARDPTNWFQVLWINKGSEDGIFKDMVAVTSSGLVGKIHRVFNERASVILITDVNSSVAARIQSSRIDGILEGRGGNRCFLKYIPQDVEVMVGEEVITSGLDGIYPDGLLIGYVKDVKKENGDFFQLIEVTVAQNLNTLEEVVILKR